MEKTATAWTDTEISELKKIRNYFGEHDKTPFEHHAYTILDHVIGKINSLSSLPSDSAAEETAQQTEQLPHVIRFLLGESEMDGAWYGESPLDKKPFWWRKKLREAWKSKSEVSDPEIEKAAEEAVKTFEADLIVLKGITMDLYAKAKIKQGFIEGANWLRSQLNTGTSQNIKP